MEELFQDKIIPKEKLSLIKKTFDKEVFKFFKTNAEEGILSEDQINQNLGFHYEINNTRVTFYKFWRKINQKRMEYIYGVTPVSEFSIFKKYIVDLYDLYSEESHKDLIFYKIKSTKEDYLLTEEQLKDNMLKILKENKFTDSNLIDFRKFVSDSRFLDDLTETKEKWTTQYCYFNGEHLCPENDFKLIKKSISKKFGVKFDKVDDIFLEWSNDTKIHKVEYTNDEIKKLIDIYNKTPMYKEEGEVYKLILASNVTNWFIKFLNSYGLSEVKFNALIGIKGNRKSFTGYQTTGLFGLTKSFEKSVFARENNINADLKNIYPICLPRYIDEIPAFSEQMKQRAKDKANGDRKYFTKNNFEQGKDWHFDEHYETITTNYLELEGDDFDDKQFTYEPKLMKEIEIKKDSKTINKIVRTFSNRVTDNSMKMGAYIYKELLKINPEELFEDILLSPLREEKQFAVLQFGERILNKLGILTEYKLNKELFLNSRLSNNSNVESEEVKVREYFQVILSQCENYNNYNLNDFILTLFSIENGNCDSFSGKEVSLYKSLNFYGIHLKYDKTKGEISFVLTRPIITNLKITAKKIFQKEFKYNSLKNLVNLFPENSEKPKNVILIDSKNKLTYKQCSGYSIPVKYLMNENAFSEQKEEKIEIQTHNLEVLE